MAARLPRDGGASRNGFLALTETAVTRQFRGDIMQRRDFVAEAVFLMGLATAPHVRASGGAHVEAESGETLGTPVQSRDEDAAVKRAVSEFYSVFYQEQDTGKYRALLTDDYLLLENGELMDAAADVALMPTRRTVHPEGRVRLPRSRSHGRLGLCGGFLKSDIRGHEAGRALTGVARKHHPSASGRPLASGRPALRRGS